MPAARPGARCRDDRPAARLRDLRHRLQSRPQPHRDGRRGRPRPAGRRRRHARIERRGIVHASMPPQTHYAKSGEINIAYQVVGNGPLDLVFVPGFVSHLDLQWADPRIARFLEKLASFSRLILFDKRGTGLSDPVAAPAPLEDRMDDVRAVMDAAGSERAALFGLSEGGPMSILFAATYPERTHSLVLCGTFATGILDPDENPGGQRWVDQYNRVPPSARTGAKGARSRCSRRAQTASRIGSDAASSSARPRARSWCACCSRCSPRPTSGTCCPASAYRRWCSTAKRSSYPSRARATWPSTSRVHGWSCCRERTTSPSTATRTVTPRRSRSS